MRQQQILHYPYFLYSSFLFLLLFLFPCPCDCSGRRRVIFYPPIHCYNCSLSLSLFLFSLIQADFHPRGNVLVAEEMISLNEFTFHPPVSLSLSLSCYNKPMSVSLSLSLTLFDGSKPDRGEKGRTFCLTLSPEMTPGRRTKETFLSLPLSFLSPFFFC